MHKMAKHWYGFRKLQFKGFTPFFKCGLTSETLQCVRGQLNTLSSTLCVWDSSALTVYCGGQKLPAVSISYSWLLFSSLDIVRLLSVGGSDPSCRGVSPNDLFIPHFLFDSVEQSFVYTVIFCTASLANTRNNLPPTRGVLKRGSAGGLCLHHFIASEE